MVAELGFGEGQHCGREEHGLVIGVGDEEADAFVVEAREGPCKGRRGRRGQRPEEEDGCDGESDSD